MFEKPGFTAGTGAMGGIKDSTYESVIARAHINPIRATRLALFFFKRVTLSLNGGDLPKKAGGVWEIAVVFVTMIGKLPCYRINIRSFGTFYGYYYLCGDTGGSIADVFQKTAPFTSSVGAM